MHISEQITKLMRLPSPDFRGVDALLSKAAPLSPDELTDIAVNVTNDLDGDVQNLYWDGGNPSDETLLSLPAAHLPELLELLLRHGLDPNHFEYEIEERGRNILSTVSFIHAICIQAPSMLVLLEHGADPNITPADDPDESIFDETDFLLSYLPGEMEENPWLFSRWLLLMAFGGICSNGHEPVTMLDGNAKSIFRDCNRFWCRLRRSAPDGSTADEWYLYIYDKASGQDVAFM